MIAGITQMNDRASDRMEGVQAAAERAGINRDQLPVIEAAYTFDDGARAFGELMALSPRPTAVMCGNDVLAVGAMQKARELGIRVPEDVSITAAEMLIKLINKQPVERQIEIPTSVVERGTLGPPPADPPA